MLKIIKETTTIKDRNILHVTPVDSLSIDAQNHTVFAMGNLNITSENVSIAGSLAASLNNKFAVSGVGVIIETPGFFFNEQKFTLVDTSKEGQLCYIDGCSNTNLVDPLRNGDPCLNYLYFPKNINQTFHTHPSVRIGHIMSGKGYATLNDTEIPLNAGDTFILDRHTLHRFRTEDSHMSLFVFHPDSEDGPRDEFNPMKSRTYISGK